MPTNLLWFSYDVYECTTNLFRINYNHLESGVHGQDFEQLKTFAINSRSLTNWKNLLQINTNQIRTSQTYYDSTRNPKIDPFVAIHGIHSLRGIVALDREVLPDSPSWRHSHPEQHIQGNPLVEIAALYGQCHHQASQQHHVQFLTCEEVGLDRCLIKAAQADESIAVSKPKHIPRIWSHISNFTMDALY